MLVGTGRDSCYSVWASFSIVLKSHLQSALLLASKLFSLYIFLRFSSLKLNMHEQQLNFSSEVICYLINLLFLSASSFLRVNSSSSFKVQCRRHSLFNFYL